jgi:hypothetical protein
MKLWECQYILECVVIVVRERHPVQKGERGEEKQEIEKPI